MSAISTKWNKSHINRVSIIIPLLLAYSLMFAQFAGGSGTEANPWQIATAEHLNNIRNYLGDDNRDKHYLQTADINLDAAPWNQGQGWEPIGVENNRFAGQYNGSRYVISGLTINRNANYQGLFGYSYTATFKNIGLIGVNINSRRSYIGGLVGYLQAGGINTSFVTGEITGGDYVGGLVGYFRTSGTTPQRTVLYNYSTASVSGKRSVGGIVGNIAAGRVIENYATGRIESLSGWGGAIHGTLNANSGTLSRNYWNIESTGQTTGGHNVGEGSLTIDMLRRDYFQNFDFVTVWRIDNTESYPYFQWEGEEHGSHNIPPLLPPRSITYEALGTEVEISWFAPSYGQPDGYNIYRDNNLLNEDPITETRFRDSDLEAFRSYQYYLTAIYGEEESNPSVTTGINSFSFAGGSGAEEDPWQIESPAQLDGIRYMDSAHYFILIAEIDLDVPPYNERNGWVPINNFQGSFNGNGFKISNLMIGVIGGLSYRAGLFAELRNAHIVNCALINVNVTGRVDVGAIAGQQRSGTISNSYVTGIVKGVNKAGGLVGDQSSDAVITNCYNAAEVYGIESEFVMGNQIIGGIAGRGYGQIINSYAVGYIQSSNRESSSGGIIGSGYQLLTNSYWNTETTGQKQWSYGEGLTALEMTQQESFTDWDFDEVWAIGVNEAATYPYLRMQGEPLEDNYPIVPPTVTTYTDGDSRAVVLWSPPSIGDPDRYLLFRNEVPIAHYINDEREHLDTNLSNFTTYAYYLKAEYGEQVSTPSNISFVTPVAGGYSMGRGTSADPYQIRFATQLSYVGYNSTAHFKQTEDIDLAAIENWIPIGYHSVQEPQAFSGSFDGNGFAISNMTINLPHTYCVGLFGQTPGDDSKPVFKNIVLENINVTGRYVVGGIIGGIYNGIIDNCHVSGVINSVDTGSARTGGIAGYAIITDITNSSTEGEVTGAGAEVGGLIGILERGTIENCFSKSSVTGRSITGGLVGKNTAGHIVHSYSIGRVSEPGGGLIGFNSGTVTNSYWNTETSGRNDSADGLGRVTAQMTYPYDANTYVDWDFANIWGHDSFGGINDGYPFLRSRHTQPFPNAAISPKPDDGALNVALDVENLEWTYLSTSLYTNPVGFRVYFNETGEFAEDDEYEWVDYTEGEDNYYSSDILPDQLEGLTTYYWKVVPTTNEPNERKAESGELRAEGREHRGTVRTGHRACPRQTSKHRNASTSKRQSLIFRGDAQDVPIWTFTTLDPLDTAKDEITPYITKLGSNYPNPFNPETTISFSLAEAGVVEISIFNIQGRKITSLLNSSLAAGRHQIIWNGRDDNGREAGSGVYFYRMKTTDYKVTRKMMLLR